MFIVASVLLSLMIIGFIIYSMNFLTTNTRQALSRDSINPDGIIRFNLEGLKELGIMK